MPKRPAARKRRPLLQRAAIHALKTLVRKHPRAAIGAAGAGAGYAITHSAKEGAEWVREKAEGLVKDFNLADHSGDQADELLAETTPEERAALLELARRHVSR